MELTGKIFKLNERSTRPYAHNHDTTLKKAKRDISKNLKSGLKNASSDIFALHKIEQEIEVRKHKDFDQFHKEWRQEDKKRLKYANDNHREKIFFIQEKIDELEKEKQKYQKLINENSNLYGDV